MSASYDEYCQRLTASAMPAASIACFAASIFYVVAILTQTSAWERVLTPVLYVQLATPLAVWALLATRLKSNAQQISLAGDLLFTAAITARLIDADTSVSSVALFLSLKMMATALFLPWRSHLQYLSAIATVILYSVCLRAGAHSLEAGPGLHQILGPVIAAALSAAGAYRAERTRRVLYEREKDLAREAQVTSALARVASELISSVDKPALMKRLCEITLETLECDASHLCLYDPSTEAFLVVAAAGYSPEQQEVLRSLRIDRRPFSSHIDQLTRSTVAQIRLNALSDQGWRRLAVEMDLSVALAMALVRRDQLIGIHSASFRGDHAPFTQAQERIARGIARIATLALENADLVDEIAQSSRVKSDFVAAISHEVRSPLSVILGYTDLLLADGDGASLTPDQRQSIERIDKSGRELHELLTVTLDLSRVAAGTLELDLETFAIDDLMEQLDSETRELRAKPGLRFGWRIVDDLPSVTSDPLKLKVILKNLIGNAVKFTEEGSVMVEVRRHDDGVEFAVVDTGIGISPESRGRIFEAFRQETGRSKRYGGVGLGLYIAQRLTTFLGGRITVDSTPGQGSTFRVWIPPTPPRHAGDGSGDFAHDAA